MVPVLAFPALLIPGLLPYPSIMPLGRNAPKRTNASSGRSVLPSQRGIVTGSLAIRGGHKNGKSRCVVVGNRPLERVKLTGTRLNESHGRIDAVTFFWQARAWVYAGGSIGAVVRANDFSFVAGGLVRLFRGVARSLARSYQPAWPALRDNAGARCSVRIGLDPSTWSWTSVGLRRFRVRVLTGKRCCRCGLQEGAGMGPSNVLPAAARRPWQSFC